MKSPNATQLKIGTLLKRLSDYPPFFVYYLAHTNRRRLTRKRKDGDKRWTPMTRPTLKEFSALSGLPERTFIRIASKLTWDDVKLKHIEPFFSACGIDLCRTEKMRNFMRHTMNTNRPFSHLADIQLKHFNEKAARWHVMMERRNSAEPTPPASA